MNGIKRIERTTTTDYVVNTIKEMIRSGELSVGAKLPSEVELCEMLGVGRSSVREGIKILVSYGFLEICRGQGTYVADNFVKSFFSILGFSHEGKDLHHFLSLRHVLENGCVQMICGKLTQKQCDALERVSIALDLSQKSVEDLVDLDQQFHSMLFEFTENPLMLKLYTMITQMIDYIMKNLMSHEDVVRDARQAHLRLVSALRTGEAYESLLAIDNHMQTVEEYARKYI